MQYGSGLDCSSSFVDIATTAFFWELETGTVVGGNEVVLYVLVAQRRHGGLKTSMVLYVAECRFDSGAAVVPVY